MVIQSFTSWGRVIAAAIAAAGLSASMVQGPIVARAAVGDVGFVTWDQLPDGSGGGGGPYACEGEAKVNHSASGAEAVGEAGCTIVVDTLAYTWTWTEISTGQILTVFSGSVNSTATLSTSSQTSLGIDGDRSVKFCLASTFQGVTAKDKCTEVGGV